MKPGDLRAGYLDRVQELEASGAPTAELGQLVQIACRYIGIQDDDLLAGAKGALYTKARRMVVCWATKRGYGLGKIANALGCAKATIAELRG